MTANSNESRPSGLCPSDERTAKDARQRLCSLGALSPYRISCTCHEGTLLLAGRVTSYHLKQLAQAAVMNMAGVDEVMNAIEVVTPALLQRGTRS